MKKQSRTHVKTTKNKAWKQYRGENLIRKIRRFGRWYMQRIRGFDRWNVTAAPMGVALRADVMSPVCLHLLKGHCSCFCEKHVLFNGPSASANHLVDDFVCATSYFQNFEKFR